MKRLVLLCSLTALSLSASAFADGKRYVVVLKHQNLIPASVDKAVQDAGGTITTRLPQIGALGVESDNPNFAAQMAADKNVDVVSEDIQYRMIPTRGRNESPADECPGAGRA